MRPPVSLLRPLSGRPFSSAPLARQARPPAPADHEYKAQHEERPPADLSQSFAGISESAFPPEATEVLLAEVDAVDVEVLPDGVPYLPEIKYRRILNKAFGPGGWALVPRSRHRITDKTVEREYALFCLGRFVSQAVGDAAYFDKSGIATATEAAKSKALMRTCKDLGVASQLWDPLWVRAFRENECERVAVEHVRTRQQNRVWRKKGGEVGYPWEEVKAGASSGGPRTWVSGTGTRTFGTSGTGYTGSAGAAKTYYKK
ncbi:mitochondrial genome maintenance MGM101-domain-containing protein [Hyaloraphidium curvatum]|nr:mitochondrial genome maintenance MGM101-domain-containing protein [Hyaloraphidium curvatum]